MVKTNNRDVLMSESILAVKDWYVCCCCFLRIHIILYILWGGENCSLEKTVRSIKSILWIVLHDSQSARNSSHAVWLQCALRRVYETPDERGHWHSPDTSCEFLVEKERATLAVLSSF
jgi:hypothetical protein